MVSIPILPILAGLQSVISLQTLDPFLRHPHGKRHPPAIYLAIRTARQDKARQKDILGRQFRRLGCLPSLTQKVARKLCLLQ